MSNPEEFKPNSSRGLTTVMNQVEFFMEIKI